MEPDFPTGKSSPVLCDPQPYGLPTTSPLNTKLLAPEDLSSGFSGGQELFGEGCCEGLFMIVKGWKAPESNHRIAEPIMAHFTRNLFL